MTDTKTKAKPRAARAKADPVADTPPATTGPTIVPSAPHLFPLRLLARATENVRQIRLDEDVTTLADDIAAHGLLQSLIGYQNEEWPDDRIYIVGGGRRLQALRELVGRGLIDDRFQVPVLVRAQADAIELSLAENLQQRTMSPVDEFFAFQQLMEGGAYSPATLAARFGFSERVVKQRLRLAQLADPILTALAERKITIDAAMAFASSQDRDLQADVFKAHSRPNAYDAFRVDRIRRDLLDKGRTEGDALFRFIGADTYEGLGGGYEDDLFGDARKERVLTHPHLVEDKAHQLVDFQMLRILRELRERADLAPTIVGYVKVNGLKLRSWGNGEKLKAPAGFALAERYDHEKMWKTIRNNRIDCHVVVGVNDKGAIEALPRLVFVPKSQLEAVNPPSSASAGYAPLTADQRAAEERQRGIAKWARRLAVGPFTGTPLEGRASWPGYDAWRQGQMGGVSGQLVEIQVFVTQAEVDAQRTAAAARYDRELAERAEADRVAREQKEAAEKRWEELEAMDPPAVVVLDGQAWHRQDDGSYLAEGDDDAFDSWAQLLEYSDEVGDTFATRADFEAAMHRASQDAEIEGTHPGADERELEEVA